MTNWSWKDVYPGARIITLVLDADEAAEFMEQAVEEGRVIAPNTVRGMPMVAFGDDPGKAPATSADIEDLAAWRRLGRGKEKVDEEAENAKPAAKAQAPEKRPRKAGSGKDRPAAPAVSARPVGGKPGRAGTRQDDAAPAVTRPDSKVTILPVVRRERRDDASRSSFMDLEPPPRPEAKPEPAVRFFKGKGKVKRGEVTEADRRMVEEAIAKGKVKITKCPPCTFALDANDPRSTGAYGRGKKTAKD